MFLRTVTSIFAANINTGTETFSFYKPNTYLLSDDFTKVRGGHQYGLGGAFSLSNWNTESNVRSMGPISFNGSVTGLPLGDFLLGRMFEFREGSAVDGSQFRGWDRGEWGNERWNGRW